ncbi:MAG: radical SAM superfamily enzyme YgiQ (UPF0313 family) [Myxococcota bacterium]|jgi:radical SAM superfamily enzyme YgiQ (UPF0313 family)
MTAVVLVSLDWMRPNDTRTGLGVASLAATLRAAGVTPVIVDDAVNRPGFDLATFARRLHAAIATHEPEWVGLGVYVWNEPEVQALLPELAGHRVVLGGPQISFAPAGTLEIAYPGAAAFVRGHGEAALLDLALGEGCPGRHGLHLRGAPDTGQRADIALDALPSPHLDGTLPPGAEVRWETQRGCPFRCSFCQHREPGGRLRRTDFGEARLHQELTAFAAAGTQRISVLDPIFHAKRGRGAALLEEAKRRGVTARLSLQCRFELLTPAFLDACESLDVELEFGLQTIHDAEGRAVQRRQRMDRVEAAVAALHARGLPFEVSLIYGLPNQTLDSFRRSVDWCLAHRVPRVRAWPLMLLRGTPLYDEREAWGFVESDDRIPIVVASHTFTRAEQAQMARIASALPATVPGRAA